MQLGMQQIRNRSITYGCRTTTTIEKVTGAKQRVPKPSRLRALASNLFRWWYVPLVVALIVVYLVSRMGAIHWSAVRDTDRRVGVDYASLCKGASIYDASPTAKIQSEWLFQTKQHPDTVIEKSEAEVLPGKCWPMRGKQGHVTIRLSSPITLSAVSYEHASLSTLRPEDVPGAPKLVQISAGMDPKQLRLVGEYHFREVPEAGPVTVASVPPSTTRGPDGGGVASSGDKVQFVKFSVLDNFGERRFTCLYRIRVFGADVKV